MMQLEQLRKNDQLPSPKGVAVAVLALSRRDNVTLAEIALVVQSDPALSGRLIKLANSASQFARPVVSIQEAIVRLGEKAVCQLALGFSLIDQYRDGACQSFDYQRYWSHSLLMALAMKELGSRVRAGAADELFLCGLLAQIGQLALATVLPKEYSAVLEAFKANPAHPLAFHERAHLETDHIELGNAMMSDWGVPEVFTQPLSLYEDQDQPTDDKKSRSNNLILMLRLAHRLGDIALALADQRSQLTKAWLSLAAQLEMRFDDVGSFIDDVIDEWHDWGTLLEIQTGGTLLEIQTGSLPSFSDLVDENEKPAKPVSSLRIVVADSNDFIRRKTVALLAESGGHTVFPASDGYSAMALVLEVRPDVIISKIRLNQIDGLALCRTLRESDEGRVIYILLMDDKPNEDLSIRAYESGADGYILSTISSRALHARLAAAQRLVHLKSTWKQDRAHLGKMVAEMELANRD